MTLLLSVLVLCTVALLGQATWRPSLSQSLDSDLDDQLCSSKTHLSTIIDIHESMERGAELMDGVRKDSLVECMTGCCATMGCDLALFKNEGLSKTGKNCYYVHCGVEENCVMVQHSAFTSVLFIPRPTSTPTGVATSPTPTESHAHSTAKSIPATTTSKVPVSSAPTTHTPTGSTSDGERSGPDTTTVAMTTTPSNEEDMVKNLTASNTSLSSGKGLAASNNEKVMAPSNSNGDPESTGDGSDDDVCSQNGCDGSGIVAVVVVAVVCFAIVVVVVAIMVKKAVDERRKRKFRNVDYLINGMYT